MIAGWSSAKVFTTMSSSQSNDVSWHLEKQALGIRTLERVQYIFHISMKTHDKHRFQLSIELN